MPNKIEISRELAERLLNWDVDGIRAVSELRAILAAPVVERQAEPVCIYWDAKTQNCLDYSPPAPVAVVLPSVKAEVRSWGHDMGGNYDEGHADGWNACLDKVKELNQ